VFQPISLTTLTEKRTHQHEQRSCLSHNFSDVRFSQYFLRFLVGQLMYGRLRWHSLLLRWCLVFFRYFHSCSCTQE